MYNRRSFLRDGALLAGALATRRLTALTESDLNAIQQLTILHTNDTHSRLEPFPMDGGRNEGLGGVAPRAELINKIRMEIDKYNHLFSQTEQVKRFVLLPHEWTIDTGELTPSLKIKRKIIERKYEEQVRMIYGSSEY